jgi:hypothetical protein
VHTSKGKLALELPYLGKCTTMRNLANVVEEFTPSTIISSFATMPHTLPYFSKMKFNPSREGSSLFKFSKP